MKKNILLISYGGGHVNMLLPIYRELKKNKNFNIVFVGCTTAQLQLAKNNIEHLNFRDLLNLYNKDEQNEMKILGSRLTDKKNHFLPEEESIAYLGINYYELIKKLGEVKAKEAYLNEGRQVFLPIETFRKFIRSFKTDLVITTNSPRSEKAVVLAAREEGVKSVIIYDFYDVKANEDRFKKDNFGDLICLPSEGVKKILMDNGRSSDSLLVTGNPIFDELKSLDKVSIENLKMKLKMDKRPVLLWLKSYNDYANHFEEIFENELLKKYSQKFNVIFRAHPSDPKFYDETLKNNRSEYRCNGMDLNEVLNLSDVILTIVSTAGQEGQKIGKTVFQIDFEPLYPTLACFELMGIGKKLKSYEDLSEVLDNYQPSIETDIQSQKAIPLIMDEIKKRFFK